MDLDVARRLDPSSTLRGRSQVVYDNRKGEIKVAVTMKGFLDSKGKPSQAHYQYYLANNGNGSFKYAYKDDIAPNKSGTSVQETAVVHSRWLRGGAGRANAAVTGGDLGASKVLFTECWNTLFRRTYYADNKNIKPTEGNAKNCVF